MQLIQVVILNAEYTYVVDIVYGTTKIRVT